MKITTTRLTALAGSAALALAVGACDEGLTGVNRNPNAPVEVSPQLLFPQGVVAAVELVRDAGLDLHLGSLWAQHIAKIQYVDEDTYEIRPQSIDGYWTSFYSGGVQDFTEIIMAGLEEEDPREFLIGPAIAMKQWTLQYATDLWGDVPYSESNQGDRTGDFTPAYDAQADVYAGMLEALETATTMLTDGEGITYGSSDPIYAGSPAKWAKFSNSLRLRVATRMSDVDPAAAAAAFQAAFNAPGGIFTSSADNALLPYTGTDVANSNPWYLNFQTREDHRMSRTLVDTLIGLSDPRLAIYAQPFTDATAPDYRGTRYRGLQNALTNVDAASVGFARTSRPGEIFIEDPTSPIYLITYPEVLFLLAEGAQRGWIPGGAAQAALHYADGIRESMRMWDAADPNVSISDAQITAYIAQAAVAYNPTTGLSQIAFQKWLHLFSMGLDAYSEYRRTGVPDLQAGPAAIISQVARRLTYPGIEQSLNEANLSAAIARQGPDALLTPVWWDE